MRGHLLELVLLLERGLVHLKLAAVVVQFVGNPCNSFRIRAVRCESSQVCVQVCNSE